MAVRDARVVLFDVFGTVVDWRTSIIRALGEFGRSSGLAADWDQIADDWRGQYKPSMDQVRLGEREWVPLDTLNRESLERVLAVHGITHRSDDELTALARAWRHLDAWPDARGGLDRLRSQVRVGTLSNGNTALLTEMARWAALPWDVILGAENARTYKPDPQMYLANVALLGLRTDEVLLAAAHNDDLEAARACGLRTAFIRRPTEWGPHQAIDLEPSDDWDFTVESIEELADAFGA